ncbi:hypothetical protein [Nocardia camponoti]|uniref:Transmembrane protein n=1 Tax=Nocardia camponoti TaxID=1616106 RepID=A0A917QHX1_9NOCA|nr:hypothetical protein [Nocardia camponoti]GGK50578.1 hypothetical protein GCM10011591_22640 [Nocardia camponoti]
MSVEVENPNNLNQIAPLPMPEDVGTARQLWWGVAGLGVVATGAFLVAISAQRDQLVTQMTEELQRSDPKAAAEMSEATIQLAVWLGFGLVGLFGLALCGITVGLAHLLARGKLWARTLLTVIAVWLVMSAIMVLVSIAEVETVTMLIFGATAIVQGVLAAGAAYLSMRADSTRYFISKLKRR